VPHVELSLTEGARRPVPRDPAHYSATLPAPDGPAGTSLERWAAVVAGATEPSLVLNLAGEIVAASASCAELIGLRDTSTVRGRRLRDAVMELVDFTASLDKLDSAEADKIPPLLAISSGRLARGLIRVACPETHAVSTMDAIATPLRDGPTVIGSLTFFARV
jgi:hypothetical protein